MTDIQKLISDGLLKRSKNILSIRIQNTFLVERCLLCKYTLLWLRRTKSISKTIFLFQDMMYMIFQVKYICLNFFFNANNKEWVLCDVLVLLKKTNAIFCCFILYYSESNFVLSKMNFENAVIESTLESFIMLFHKIDYSRHCFSSTGFHKRRRVVFIKTRS